jgi:hypothetical protein
MVNKAPRSVLVTVPEVVFQPSNEESPVVKSVLNLYVARPVSGSQVAEGSAVRRKELDEVSTYLLWDCSQCRSGQRTSG